MSAIAERLTLQRFRELYGECKPNFELINGEAVQKPLATNFHSILQFVLALMLQELGYRPRTELSVVISDSWVPTPDVCGLVGPDENPYPTQPVAVAIEILSPDDRFTPIIQRCRKYAAWGVSDILVFDPVGREAWHWDVANGGLAPVKSGYAFHSRPVELSLSDVFRRLDEQIL